MYRKCGYLPAIGASGVNGVSVSIVEILLPTLAKGYPHTRPN